MEQEVKLCDDVETVSEFTYLGDRMSAGGGCDGMEDVGELRLGSVVSVWQKVSSKAERGCS